MILVSLMLLSLLFMLFGIDKTLEDIAKAIRETKQQPHEKIYKEVEEDPRIRVNHRDYTNREEMDLEPLNTFKKKQGTHIGNKA